MLERARPRMGPVLSYAVGVGSSLAVLWPAFAEGARDSFPLSTYPMFARSRGQLVLHAVVGIDERGRRSPLPPTVVGSGEVLQTKALVERAARGGSESLERLCGEVAARVSRSDHRPSRIEIVRRRFDPVAYFSAREKRPLAEESLHACVPPAPSRSAR